MTLQSNNLSPYLTYVEGSTPASPAAGQQRLFIDSADHKVKRVNSSGTVTTVEGGGGGTDPLTTKGDIWVYSTTDARLGVGSDYDTLHGLASATPGLAWHPGGSVLLYDYTVTGSAKASIDTGVDSPAAGVAGTSAFPALRVLHVYVYARCDTSAATENVLMTFNNDTTTANYYFAREQDSNTTVSGGTGSVTGVALSCPAASAAANNFGATTGTIPNYAGTVGYKSATFLSPAVDPTAGNVNLAFWGGLWESTSAITRLKITPQTAAKNLVVGSRLLIYAT